jgi:hypothetical protein
MNTAPSGNYLLKIFPGLFIKIQEPGYIGRISDLHTKKVVAPGGDVVKKQPTEI